MASPLSGSLAATIYSGMRNLFLDATLMRDVVLPTSPAYDPADPPAPTPVEYTCKAIKDNYTLRDRADGLILQGDVKILILANSISVSPLLQDRVTIQGVTFTLVDASVDPAMALWTCQGRK